jgi:hypothetical protein
MNMIEECVVIYRFNKDNLKKNSIPIGSITPRHNKKKGPNYNEVDPPHHILLSKGEKTNIQGVVGHIGSEIFQTHFKPTFPTLTLANHVPIIPHMGMM